MILDYSSENIIFNYILKEKNQFFKTPTIF